ncbi:hypothetical protein NDS46_15750 [Paenibacillus thiaminolyticus]|uniref:hypothetical protein n=1 Tax=Paenibacillus thiaminolyticus TaxID=49283 RepID=UPI00232E9573|nr:hypothetical protein [Paenibacillus thiaminolyticus]WCF05845.1 hypothetical protein NDS46_15750 [Paenibacillus thiaminolyticus]
MCQKTFHQVPLRILVQSMCQLMHHVQENTGHCKEALSEQDSRLNAALREAEHTAGQLCDQLEQLMRELESREGEGQSRQTMITYFD